MNPLAKAQVGKTRLQVTRLGLGGVPPGGLFQDVAEAAATRTIRRALTVAINFMDTAPLYGHGKSESYFGKALGVARDSYVLATNVGRVLEPVEPGKLERAEFDNPALSSRFSISAMTA